MKRTTPPDRLSRDAMAARAAGLSYGNYKALHPCTPGEWEPVEVELEDDRREITCQFCGKTFLAYGQEARRKYCSDECRQQAQYAAYRAKHPIPVAACAICGKEFPRRSGKRYCSKACGVEGYRRKQAEWNGRRPHKRKEKTDDKTG